MILCSLHRFGSFLFQSKPNQTNLKMHVVNGKAERYNEVQKDVISVSNEIVCLDKFCDIKKLHIMSQFTSS